MENRGKFIVFEGGEKTGTTTMAKKLLEIFPPNTAVLGREPGGPETSEAIREILLSKELKKEVTTEILLFFGSRFENIKHFIIPALNANKIVISDRFDLSTLAYQVGLLEGVYLSLFRDLISHFSFTLEYYPKPDLLILLDVDPEEGLKRAKESDKKEFTYFEEKGLDYHKRVREGYYKYVREYEHIVINTLKNNEEETFEIILSEVEKLGLFSFG